jgi:hypothetical protein
MSKYPHEFLGRCAVCLDNAYLSREPCRPSLWLNGSPVVASECPIYLARRRHDEEREKTS